ncbi:MAG: tRNA epoxyqueuosine(34) reductase QueG [bacterium]|nr:tRNA epoxyqueuosine(34) reductase QueG [bacterium]MDE0667630.1 tRNA epoxyqueuosine(34) reductase QueG [bacterium]
MPEAVGDDAGRDGSGESDPHAGLRAETLEAGRRAGLTAVGVAAVEVFAGTRRDLRERRADGLAGGMQFTYRNPDRSTDPSRILPGASSLVVGAMRYARVGAPPPRLAERSAAGVGEAETAAAQPEGGRPRARVARYATGDVYGELRSALGAVSEVLRAAGYRAVVVADDNALVDREAAHRAGLGYYGKSSNLLLPGAGSWFVLGSVVTDAALRPAAERVPDGCGPCRRCLDGCPTGAIIAPGVVDARRCLAWLLQAAGDFPVEFREALGDRIYGCDDCQEVCPPNRRPESDTPDRPGDSAQDPTLDVLALLAAGDEDLMERYGRWYIPERDPRYLRRNALVVLGNVGCGGDPQVLETVQRYRRGDDEMLARHADWVASRLGIAAEATPATTRRATRG